MEPKNKQLDNYQIVSLDVGQRRVGLASANSQIRISHPLAIVDFKQAQPWLKLQRLINEVGPKIIVIGQPKNEPDWWIKWYNQFQEEVDCQSIEIVFQNEVLTSRAASDLRPDRGRIDDQAARLILDDYLEKIKNE